MRSMYVRVGVGVIALALTFGAFFITHSARGSGAPQTYIVVPSPGRGAPVDAYERLLNEKAAQGYQFEGWCYRGSVQEPDLIFKKK